MFSTCESYHACAAGCEALTPSHSESHRHDPLAPPPVFSWSTSMSMVTSVAPLMGSRCATALTCTPRMIHSPNLMPSDLATAAAAAMDPGANRSGAGAGRPHASRCVMELPLGSGVWNHPLKPPVIMLYFPCVTSCEAAKVRSRSSTPEELNHE